MKTATSISYRDSHKYAAKGVEYERHYESQAWDRFLWSREREILLTILKKYFTGRDVHLLDFACGTGRITRFLEDRVKTSTGVDVSSSMLAIAKAKLKRTEIIEADITTENILKLRKFNLITAFRSFSTPSWSCAPRRLKRLPIYWTMMAILFSTIITISDRRGSNY